MATTIRSEQAVARKLSSRPRSSYREIQIPTTPKYNVGHARVLKCDGVRVHAPVHECVRGRVHTVSVFVFMPVLVNVFMNVFVNVVVIMLVFLNVFMNMFVNADVFMPVFVMCS
jgi:hypothetical protein